MSQHGSPRVLVVGSGWRFTSGISYYTCRLANALATSVRTDVVLMRQLVPTRLYPGRDRVGQDVNDLTYAEGVDVLDGVDWWWGRSMREATTFIRERRPDVVVLQWWTGAVLHSYLRLVREARRHGARVVVEWHEVQDTGEARLLGTQRYVQVLMRRLLRNVDAHVVHSTYDRDLLEKAYGITDGGASVTVIPHGPYDHVGRAAPDAAREADRFTLLFFGVIRPYKGLEDLVAAFEALPPPVRDAMRLSIVGEPWEGWTAPLEAVAASPVRDQITLVDRYVTDAEAREHFATADAVVLPYRRSSSSGPLHMAMSAGLPVVVSSVGGLVEAAGEYGGVRFVPPADVPALATALAELPATRGQRHADVQDWATTVMSYRRVFDTLAARQPRSTPVPTGPAPSRRG